MSSGVRVPLEEATLIAGPLVASLAPACYRIQMAGSYRRAKPTVGDLEIVAIPRIEDEPDGMFGQRRVNRLRERIDEMLVAGELASHPTHPARGDRYSRVIEPASGLQVDIFSARVGTWGLILLIRTGPAEYSREFVTGLRKRALHAAGGELHVGGLECGTRTCEVVPTPEEIDVYRAARWSFVNPEDR